ncbi:hypothetical protein [Rhodoblastus sp.]|uniref:hypothetical protein n=1 Tax=Rhodoblastus sp. TaxID=1962975 RepID=UPI003F94C098
MFDALADAARLIATRGLLAKSAARRGKWHSFIENMRVAAEGLAEACEIAAMVGRAQQ